MTAALVHSAGVPLISLKLNHNNLTGELPSNFCRISEHGGGGGGAWCSTSSADPSITYSCHKLSLLDLSQNNFQGSVPWDSIIACEYLAKLDLSDNMFSGALDLKIIGTEAFPRCHHPFLRLHPSFWLKMPFAISAKHRQLLVGCS